MKLFGNVKNRILIFAVAEETTSDTEPAETSAVVTSTSGSTTTPAETSVTTLVPDMAPFQGLMLTVQFMETEPVEGFSPVVWIDEGFDYDTTLPEPDGLMTEDTKAPETEMMTVAVTTADEADAVTSGAVPDTGMIAAVVEHTTIGTEDIFAGDFIYETIPVIIITTPETTTTDTEAETTVTTTEEVTAATAETTVKATTPAITTSVSQPVMAVNAPPNNTIIPTVTTPARGYAPIPDVPRVPVGVSISSVNFPDEVFRAYVIRNFDSDGNGYLDAAETEAAERIYLFSDNNVKSFEGIKYLTSLKYLNCREDSGVKSLDLSGNPELETLLCEDSVNLSSIKLAANSKLKDLRLEGTSIHSVNLSGCTVLQTIYCNNASLAYLDVSRCPNIRIFSVENNICPVTLTDNRFDLSTIPGFSVSRISRLRGAVLDGSVLTFTQDTVSYTYDCGQGHSGTFSLKAANYINASDPGSYPVIGGGVYGSAAEVTAGKEFDVIISVPPVNDSADVIEFRLDYDQEAFEIVSTDSSYSLSGIINYGDGKWVLAAVRSQADIDLSKGLKFTLKFRCRDTAASGAYVFRLSKSLISRINEVGSSGEIMLWQPEITVRNINVTGPASTGVAIDSTNFPDDDLRNFIITRFDIDKDGCLSAEEIDKVKDISIGGAYSYSGKNYLPDDLTGLEFFTLLEELVFSATEVSNVDLSYNTELSRLSCSLTKLTSLDIRNNSKLDYLECTSNTITYLDVSHNPELTYLSVHSNQLAYIDLTNNPKIKTFNAAHNVHPVTLSTGNKFDLSAIDGFDITRASDLVGAALDGTVLTFTQDTVSYTYDCGQGFSVSFSLKADNFNETSGSTGVAIDSTNFPDSTFRTYVSDNIDTDGNEVLSEEEIALIKDLSGVKFMNGIYSVKGIEYFTSLEKLDCSGTGITSLDVSANTSLSELVCDNTQISSLDLINNTKLRFLVCSVTNISELDLDGLSELEILKCSETNITSLDLSSNPALAYLDCSQTAISVLNLNNNPVLDYLYCSDTKISRIDISNNTSMVGIMISGTKITSIDLSQNPSLCKISLSNNHLPFVDLTNVDNVNLFNVSGNAMPIPLSDTFDLNQIPGFDVSRMSDLTGAELDADGHTLINITGNVTYTYDCGQGHSETFTLVPTEGVTLSFGSAGEAISAPVSAENVSAPDGGDLQMPQKIYMPESHAEVYVAAVVAAVSVTVIAAVIVRRARKRSGEKEYDKK